MCVTLNPFYVMGGKISHF